MMETTKTFNSMNYSFTNDSIPMYESYSILGSFVKMYGVMMCEFEETEYKNMSFTDMMIMYDFFLRTVFIDNDDPDSKLAIVIGRLYKNSIDKFSNNKDLKNKFVSLCKFFDKFDKTKIEFGDYIGFILTIFRCFTMDIITYSIDSTVIAPLNNVTMDNAYKMYSKYKAYEYFCEDNSGNRMSFSVDCTSHLVTITSSYVSSKYNSEYIVYETLSMDQSSRRLLFSNDFNVNYDINSKAVNKCISKNMKLIKKLADEDFNKLNKFDTKTND